MYLPQPSGGDFELVPAGTHLATCFRVIDLGTQKSTYEGKEREQHKILISWEFPDELMDDGRPFTVGQRYTWSMSEKATLRKHLESWRGQAFADKDFAGPPNGFNIQNILGKSCLLTIAHKENGDKTYANITAVAKLMKGMEPKPPLNVQMFLWLDNVAWDVNIFNQLGQGLQDIVKRSPEYVNLTSPAGKPTHDIAGRSLVHDERNPPDDMNDDMPF